MTSRAIDPSTKWWNDHTPLSAFKEWQPPRNLQHQRIVKAFDAGKQAPTIAHEIGTSTHTVISTLKRYGRV